MCFAIPYKIKSVVGKTVLLENDKEVIFENNLPLKKNCYVRVVDNLIVDVLSKKEGLKIRRLIKSLNVYE